MLGYLLGAYATSVVSGLVIVYSLHGSSVVHTSSHVLSPAGEIVVGTVALCAAVVVARGRVGELRTWRRQRKRSKAGDRPAKDP